MDDDDEYEYYEYDSEEEEEEEAPPEPPKVSILVIVFASHSLCSVKYAKKIIFLLIFFLNCKQIQSDDEIWYALFYVKYGLKST